MAKIKVHELAKELEIQSKDIINFVQNKGLEVKAAQSSLEDDVAAMVRREFAKGSKASQTETITETAVKPQAAKSEVTKEAPAGKPEAKDADGEAPKKKKKIIFVSNPQNSKVPGQKPQPGGQRNYSSSSGYSSQGNYSSASGYSSPVSSRPGAGNRPVQNVQNSKGRTQAQAPVRPIKPLTPPSPTPSVQMVSGKPQTTKVRPAAEVKPEEAKPADVKPADVKPVETKSVETKPVETKPIQPEIVKIQNEQKDVVSTAPQDVADNRPVENKVTEEKVMETRSAEAKAAEERTINAKPVENRATENRGYENRFSQNRSQENRGQDNRNQENRGAGNRVQDNRGREGRPQGRFEGNGRNQDFRTGERSQGSTRIHGGDNRFRDGRSQEGRSQDFRNQEGRGQEYRGQDGRSQGRFEGNRGGANNGKPSFNRQENGQRPARPGFDGGQGERRMGGSGQEGGRGFGGNGRDGRDSRGNGGQGDRFRGRSADKDFVVEAPTKDLEKKREEEKRRFSQEKDKRNRKDLMYEEEELQAQKNKPGRFIKPEKKKEEVVEEAIKVITVGDSITIKELADKMKMQPANIIKKLFMQGKIVTVNQEISYEDAENIAMEYEILCEKEEKVDVIEELLKEEEESEEDLVERPPVVCVMGHVDHGKTSLLDAIRKTNVTDREAGGITQHIGAYTVNVSGRKITFLDTPGHEAFTAMRMRGANSTDIAILVVAADDGVMPQTIEAINHAKAAGVEIIVAVNKIDKPSANVERVKQELTEYELVAEDWGGNTIFAPVSAKSGEGIEALLEMILLTADIMELKANPKRTARGLVIEAQLDKGRGPVATALIQKGTLRVGDFVSAGACYGKVRAMIDDKGRRVKEAGPSTPVEILGLSDVPTAGEVILSHASDKTAKSYAETYLAQNKEKMLEETKSRMSLDDLFSQIQEGNLKELNLIVKADVQGSVEAVKQSLLKLSNEEVVVKCIHGGVGAVNESDVMLAMASSAIIIGFNVRVDATAKANAEREGVDVRLYKVIYQAIEDVEAAMKGMLDPVYEEKVIGHAEVRQIFRASAIGNIAGSYVLDGVFQRGCKVRISREGKPIFEGNLASLKRFKDDVKEVRAGYECGLVFEGYDQMQELDIVEAYIMVEVPR